MLRGTFLVPRCAGGDIRVDAGVATAPTPARPLPQPPTVNVGGDVAGVVSRVRRALVLSRARRSAPSVKALDVLPKIVRDGLPTSEAAEEEGSTKLVVLGIRPMAGQGGLIWPAPPRGEHSRVTPAVWSIDERRGR